MLFVNEEYGKMEIYTTCMIVRATFLCPHLGYFIPSEKGIFPMYYYKEPCLTLFFYYQWLTLL